MPTRRLWDSGGAVLTEGGITVSGMATTEERLGTLEVRVDNLGTWAGPGQAGALAAGQAEIRAELAKVRQTQDRHTRMLADLTADVSGLKTDVSRLNEDVAGLKQDVAGLKQDVAGLKQDVAELKEGLREVLNRLPAAPDR